MRICGDILQNAGHLVIRSAVYVHANYFSHRVFVIEVFPGSRLCEDDGMNLIQRFLFAAQDKGKVENIKELLIHTYEFRFV